MFRSLVFTCFVFTIGGCGATKSKKSGKDTANDPACQSFESFVFDAENANISQIVAFVRSHAKELQNVQETQVLELWRCKGGAL